MKRVRTRYLRRDVISVGIRLGYWPCVGGPFAQLNVGRHYLSIWYGLPLTTLALEA